MRRKMLVVTILILSMLLQCVIPFVTVHAASGVAITLNSNLYNSVKNQLQKQRIIAEYRDATNLIIISEDELAKVTKLDLSNSGIDDLSGGSSTTKGLEAFSNLHEINLHANYLTADSNLGVLDNFENLNTVDLSSNQLSSVKSIKCFHDSDKVFDITNQRITGRTILKIDSSEVSERRVTQAIVALPDILSENQEGFNTAWLYDNNGELTTKVVSYTDPETGVTTTPDIDYSTSFGTYTEGMDISNYYDCTNGAVAPFPYIIVNVAEDTGEGYRVLKGMIKFSVIINDSKSKLANSQMTYEFSINNELESGIVFHDANFYKAVKDQLTYGQTINLDPTVKAITDVRNVYKSAYDDELILVIDKEDLINNIPTLLLNDKRIKDLKGLEEFVGLESNLDISYNYITTLQRVIELQENKVANETNIRNDYNEVLTNLEAAVLSYDEAVAAIKEAQEKYDKATQELAGISDATARAAKINEMQGYLNTINTNQETVNKNTTAIKKYEEKLYTIFEKEYQLVSLLPNEVNILSYDGLIAADLGTVQGYTDDIIDRISELEQKGGLSSYESWAIKKLMTDWGASIGLEFKTQKTVYRVNSTTGAREEVTETIEYPISEFLKEVSEGTTLSITDYEKFIYIFKCIDALSQVEQYCSIKRAFEGTTDNYVQEAINTIEKIYDEKGYDLYFYNLILRDPVTGAVKEATVGANKLSTGTASTGIELIANGLYSVDIGLAQSQYSGAISDISMMLSHRQALITEEDLMTFVTLPRIKALNIADNKVGKLTEIESLAELRELNAWKNMVNDISDVDWSRFTELKKLNLGYNQISDISSLQPLLNLEELNVSYNLLEGRFTFRLINMKNLKIADFSHNQYNDIQYANDQYILKAMGYDANGDGKPDGYSVLEYLAAIGVNVSFQYQTLEMQTTILNNNEEFVEFELPLIFRQLENMDYARTSFGIDSIGGLVEPEGKTVKVRTIGLGTHLANVSVEGRNGYEYTTDGIGYGTTCKIRYTIVEGTEVPVTPSDVLPHDEPTNPTTPTTPEEQGTPVYGYAIEEGIALVLTPETSLDAFAAKLVDMDKYNVKITENKSRDKIGTGAVATIESKDGSKVYDMLEVVVKGDINGDGEVDALDSGIIRTVINDTASLIGVFDSAADVNSDGEIDSQDAILILQFRADRIRSFE